MPSAVAAALSERLILFPVSDQREGRILPRILTGAEHHARRSEALFIVNSFCSIISDWDRRALLVRLNSGWQHSQLTVIDAFRQGSHHQSLDCKGGAADRLPSAADEQPATKVQ
jgi:hypothetical protein